MYCNNFFSGKYWTVFGSKLSGQSVDPDYRGTTVLHENVPVICSVNISLRLEYESSENQTAMLGTLLSRFVHPNIRSYRALSSLELNRHCIECRG